MMLDMLHNIRQHPYSFIIELTADEENDLTFDDLEKVVLKDKLSTVTDVECSGLRNFEIMIEKVFDTAETKLSIDI